MVNQWLCLIGRKVPQQRTWHISNKQQVNLASKWMLQMKWRQLWRRISSWQTQPRSRTSSICLVSTYRCTTACWCRYWCSHCSNTILSANTTDTVLVGDYTNILILLCWMQKSIFSTLTQREGQPNIIYATYNKSKCNLVEIFVKTVHLSMEYLGVTLPLVCMALENQPHSISSAVAKFSINMPK